MTTTLAERFHKLFAGSDRGHGYTLKPTGEISDKGKVIAKSFTSPTVEDFKNGTLDQPTVQLWEKHLDGDYPSLGVPLLRSDNMVTFGAIDVDKYLTADALMGIVTRIEELMLPLIPVRSKSGGLHLYCFSSDWIPAGTMRNVLLSLRDRLDLGEIEEFPKQTELTEKKPIGNWINSPYHGLTTRCAVRGDGSGLTADEFLEKAEMFRSACPTKRFEDYLAAKVTAPEVAKPKFVLPDEIPDGQRNDTLYKYGCSLRAKGADEDEIREKVTQANEERCKPPVPADELALIVSQAMTEKKGTPRGMTPGFSYDPPDGGDLYGTVWDSREKEWRKVFVSSFLECVGDARDEYSLGHARVIRYKTPHDGMKIDAIPMSILDTAEFPAWMREHGVTLSVTLEGKNLLKALLGKPMGVPVKLVKRTGWHGGVFALPECQFGDSDEQIMLEGRPKDHPFKTQGAYAAWQELASLCRNNSRLVFAICTAFAGPLQRFRSGASNTVFHLFGGTSKGKTTTAHVAGSVWGGMSRKSGYSDSWRTTSNAIENTAGLHMDGLLIMDEIHMVDPQSVLDISYLFGSGATKARMKANGDAREGKSFRLVVLSTGEDSISTYIQKGGRKQTGGSSARMIDIPAVPQGSNFGVFEDIHGMADGATFSKHLELTARENFGWAIRIFLEKIVADLETIGDGYRQLVEEIQARLLCSLRGKGAAEIGRNAESFALVAAAGEIATQMGITGWDKGEAEKAATQCFLASIDERGTLGGTDEANHLRFVRRYIEQYARHFEEVHGGTFLMPDRYGLRWTEAKEVRYLWLKEIFQEHCTKEGYDMKAVVGSLKKADYLRTNEAKGLTYQRKLNSEHFRGYCIILPPQTTMESEYVYAFEYMREFLDTVESALRASAQFPPLLLEQFKETPEYQIMMGRRAEMLMKIEKDHPGIGERIARRPVALIE